MKDGSGEQEGEQEYYELPEEALPHLPEEWRTQFQKLADDGRAVLQSVDTELSQLVRLTNATPALAALRHAHKRLSEHKFAADMDALLELDMLTTAFVVTYVRLFQGGSGGGFARDALPVELRDAHDEILSLRNKRFAHTDEHPSMSNAMQIQFDHNRFELEFKLTLGYYVGGANAWAELVEFLHDLFARRLEKLLDRMKDKTGRDWVFPTGPAPN